MGSNTTVETFEVLARRFDDVTAAATTSATSVGLGPLRVLLRHNQPGLGHDVLRALWPPPVQTSREFDLMCLSASDPLVSSLLPPVGLQPAVVFASELVTGQRWLFDVGGGVHTGIDLQRGKGLVIYSEHAYQWLICSPFRTAAQWLASDAGVLLMHAAAVGRPDGGILLLGPGRAGKSTTALATVAAGGVAAGDDYVWVQEHVAVSCFRTVKTRHSSQLVPMSVTTALPGFDMNYDEPKRVHYLADRPEAMTRHLPLVAAVVVRQGASETAWRSIPRVEAFLHAAPSSLFQASADHEQQLAAISALLAALPCFELAVSDDLNDVGSGVLRLVDSLLGEPPT